MTFNPTTTKRELEANGLDPRSYAAGMKAAFELTCEYLRADSSHTAMMYFTFAAGEIEQDSFPIIREVEMMEVSK